MFEIVFVLLVSVVLAAVVAGIVHWMGPELIHFFP
jgi:hypothetical protein